MSGALEGAANRWLSEPPYLKVFKNTFDVVEDYVAYGLSGVGAIALSVKFLSSLGTGDVICIMTAIQNGTQDNKFGPYPVGAGSAVAMVNYANFDSSCIDAALSTFMQWLPFLLIIQALLLIIVEKGYLKMPRISGKIEIFYKSIVEASLYGNDPDVAEDLRDEKSNIDAISRRRRRKEIGNNLKQSSFIYKMYILKNAVEFLLIVLFIPINFKYHMDAYSHMEPSHCRVHVREFPEIGLDEGSIHFQCKGKKVSFFLILIYIHQTMLFLFSICSLGALIWCIKGRKISQLLFKMENETQHKDSSGIYYKALKNTWDRVDMEAWRPGLPMGGSMGTFSNTDFYFLFDLLAHSSGIEPTLRVLTHADETFQKICMPNIETDNRQQYVKNVKLEEDKLKVCWKASDFECWILENPYGHIKVDSYVVTIFPAEMMSNRKAVKATLMKGDDPHNDDNMYTTEFIDLQGGTTEYVITIACVIGQSRMKGIKIVTPLVPYGAEKPSGGLVKMISTDQAEIAWQPPKGGFGKYVLTINKIIQNPKAYGRQSSALSNHIHPVFGPLNYMDMQTYAGYSIDDVRYGQDPTNAEQIKRELGNKVTNFDVFGLSPGEPYEINLKTKTGIISTRHPLTDIFLTKPLKVHSLKAESIRPTEAKITWVKPEGHPSIKAFNVSFEHIPEREVAVKYEPSKSVCGYNVTNLSPATAYTVQVSMVCVHPIRNRYAENIKTVSEPEKFTFATPPHPPTNLELENRQCNSLTVKWDPATNASQSNQKFRLTIEAPEINYFTSNSQDISGKTYNFSKLPEIIGTGQDYKIKVESVVKPHGYDDKEVVSEPLVRMFKTKPLPPTNFRIGHEENMVIWTKSATPKVTQYRLKYRKMKKEDELKDSFGENQKLRRPSRKISAINLDGLKKHGAFPTVVKKVLDEESTHLLAEMPNDGDDGSKPEEVLIASSSEKANVSYAIENMVPMIQYRVNISAIVEDQNGEQIESKPLHTKIILTIDQHDENRLSVYSEDCEENRLSLG